MAAGSLYLLHDVQDLARIPLRKNPAAMPPRISDALVVQFVDLLLAVAGRWTAATEAVANVYCRGRPMSPLLRPQPRRFLSRRGWRSMHS